MVEKRQLIKVSRGLKEDIAKKFGVTVRTVNSAMNFETKSPTARILRSYALNNGGELFERVNKPVHEQTISIQ